MSYCQRIALALRSITTSTKHYHWISNFFQVRQIPNLKVSSNPWLSSPQRGASCIIQFHSIVEFLCFSPTMHDLQISQFLENERTKLPSNQNFTRKSNSQSIHVFLFCITESYKFCIFRSQHSMLYTWDRFGQLYSCQSWQLVHILKIQEKRQNILHHSLTQIEMNISFIKISYTIKSPIYNYKSIQHMATLSKWIIHLGQK